MKICDCCCVNPVYDIWWSNGRYYTCSKCMDIIYSQIITTNLTIWDSYIRLRRFNKTTENLNV